MTIDSSGRVFQPSKPMMALRGASNFSGSSPFTTDSATDSGNDISAISNLREVTAWGTIDVNQGNMYGGDGRMTAPVAGIYHFSIQCNRTYSQNDTNRHLWVVHRPAGSSTVETICYAWTNDDYGWYSLSFEYMMSLSANDQISVGAYNNYGWHPDKSMSHFTAQLVG